MLVGLRQYTTSGYLYHIFLLVYCKFINIYNTSEHNACMCICTSATKDNLVYRWYPVL